MTDMRRTLLWAVFLMSLVLLWDGWNKHNGHPSMFSPAPAARPAAAASPAGGNTANATAPGVAAAATGASSTAALTATAAKSGVR